MTKRQRYLDDLADQIEADQCAYTYPDGSMCNWSRFYHRPGHGYYSGEIHVFVPPTAPNPVNPLDALPPTD